MQAGGSLLVYILIASIVSSPIGYVNYGYQK
jgi:hypothetical protein